MCLHLSRTYRCGHEVKEKPAPCANKRCGCVCIRKKSVEERCPERICPSCCRYWFVNGACLRRLSLNFYWLGVRSGRAISGLTKGARISSKHTKEIGNIVSEHLFIASRPREHSAMSKRSALTKHGRRQGWMGRSWMNWHRNIHAL